jgi:hypothetical protein
MCLSHLIYTVRPYLIHTCHAAPMPCSDHAVLLKATAQHGRRETACGLPSCFRLLPATTRSSTKFVIRSIPILLTTIHTYDCKVWYRHATKKTICQTVGQQFEYFRLPRRLTGRTRHCWSRAGERHDMCELTHVMAEERHGPGMLCVNPPL